MGGGSGTGFWADKFVQSNATKQALKKNFIMLVGSLGEMQFAGDLDSFFFEEEFRSRKRDSARRSLLACAKWKPPIGHH
jgi:hypothetical protein